MYCGSFVISHQYELPLHHGHGRESHAPQLSRAEERVHRRPHDDPSARQRALAVYRLGPVARAESLGGACEVRHAYDAFANIGRNEGLGDGVEPAVASTTRTRRLATRATA